MKDTNKLESRKSEWPIRAKGIYLPNSNPNNHTMPNQMTASREVNNFDVLRILFAWFVVISHSYFLNNDSISDPLGWATDNYLIFSYIGVKGFFVISGYLIFQSLIRSQSVYDYLVKRVLRIFPGLIMALALSLLVIYFVYPSNKLPYLLNPEIFTYFIDNVLLFKSHFDIPGVFENMRSKAVNGSLWTIKFEFLCYLFLLLVFPFRKIKKNYLFFIVTMLSCCVFLPVFLPKWVHAVQRPIQLALLLELGSYFFMGSFWACFAWEEIPFKQWAFTLSTSIILLCILLKADRIFLLIPLSFVIMHIGKKKSVLASWIHQTIGDPSYGMYLYAFPLQQFMIFYLKPTTIVLLILSSVLSLMLGILSWYFVEKKALILKNYFLKPVKK